ncbi:MAG: hypothetical protein V7K67_26825 [Nostoc sp.]|uniref:hypothetical protein n=1 Tax=Nostoc sp. TaxID=1180 RepID=UPI002FF9941D
MLIILFLIGIGIYFSAGWVISEITFKLYEQIQPEYFWNYHRGQKAPWDLNTTKLILKLFLIIFWAVAFFSVKSEITKIIDLKNLKT